MKLLAAERIHLLANDLRDLLVDSPAERKIGVDAGRHAAHEPSAQQKLMARQLGLPGRLAQGG